MDVWEPRGLYLRGNQWVNLKIFIVSGFVELFHAPVDAYKRDGRVLRGVRRGASAFSNSTAVAALELSGRLFDWIDFAASLTHDMVRNLRNPIILH